MPRRFPDHHENVGYLTVHGIGRFASYANVFALADPLGRLASSLVRNKVSTSQATSAETIKRIGPSLVVGSVLGSTFGIVIAQFLDDLGDGVLAEIVGGEAVLFNNRFEVTGAADIAGAGGFLLCLIVGFLVLFSYPTARGQGVARLTLLWAVLHILRQAFAQALMLPFAGESQLALAYGTFDAPPGLDTVIAAAGGVGLLLIAISAASAFVAFTPHRKVISKRRSRFTFVLWIALIPAAASVFLAIPFFSPDEGSGVIPALPLTAVMFFATLVAAPGSGAIRGPEDRRDVPWPWGLAATLLVILLVEVLILRGGVSVDPRQWG